jgi:aspartate aminotransferase
MPRTAVAAKVESDIKSASWIREMFERGRRLRAELGEQNIFDFSLGNPNASPPPEFFDALREVAAQRQPAMHRYMPNAGFDEARSAVARFLTGEYGVEFDTAAVILTSGAAGAANLMLRATLDPGDEVIILSPYFPEYRFYIEQAQGVVVAVESDGAFQPDVAAIERAITARTRAILLNSPNNPTGAVYSEDRLRAIAALLSEHDRDDRPIYLICDDVYRRVVYVRARCPTTIGRYPRAVIVSSYSKDLSIPGERIGYVALPPMLPQRGALAAALTMLNRTLGFVNATALVQRIVARCATACCDIEFYRTNRDLLCHALREYGYELEIPAGALYAFPRTPIEDDVAFVDLLLKHRILAVPGRGFGRPGHMRLSYCVDRATIEGSLPGFRRAIEEVRSSRTSR